MRQTRLNVKGMSCASCVRHVHGALTELDGVETVDVQLRAGVVLVSHGPDVEAAALTNAVAEAGYEAEVAA